MRALRPSQALFPLALALLAPFARGQVVVSNFATDADGWVHASGGDLSTTVTWTATGGVGGGGGLVLNDAASGANDYFGAPAKFLGNQSVFYGGTLSLDLIVNYTPNNNPDNIILSNGTLSIAHALSPTPNTSSFTSYAISFLDTSGWSIAGTGGATPLTTGQMLSVLGSLTDFRILGDWRDGTEANVLDNVQFTAVPEPAAAPALLASAAVGLAVVRRRRSRRGV